MALLRIVLTWGMTLLVVDLHVACVTQTPRRISGRSDQARSLSLSRRSASPAVHSVGFEPWRLAEMEKCLHALPSTIHCAEGHFFYRFRQAFL